MVALISISAVVAALVTATCASTVPLQARAVAPFGQRAIFRPPTTYRTPKVLYPRSVILNDGSLLATWENYSPEPPKVYFPIYKSTNQGASWTSFSTIQDTQNGWGLRYQPELYVLPSTWAGFPAGTVLAAGNSIPSDLSATRIDLYASTNGGSTWSFVSNVARGGRASVADGETPVWEPFLLLFKGVLYVYYSDSRDPAHSQKLVHQSSTDGKTWSSVVNDVTYSNYNHRPGMATIAALPNGRWMMTYEYPGGNNGNGVPVYYKISNNPTSWNSITGTLLRSSDGKIPNSGPYVTWSAAGGVNGTICVSGANYGEIFTNTKLGDPTAWRTRSTTLAAGYSRELRPLDKVGSLMLLGAGPLGGDNYVSNAIINL